MLQSWVMGVGVMGVGVQAVAVVKGSRVWWWAPTAMACCMQSPGATPATCLCSTPAACLQLEGRGHPQPCKARCWGRGWGPRASRVGVWRALRKAP